jgi:hypothetical protein
MADVKAVDVDYAYRKGRISVRRTGGFGYLKSSSYI